MATFAPFPTIDAQLPMDRPVVAVQPAQAERAYQRELARREQDRRILDLARERFRIALAAEGEWRRMAVDDLRFRAGEQWDSKVYQERTSGPQARPCLVINQMPKFIRQVTNDERQNRPSIKVKPVDSGSDPDTAKVYQGLIRHIEVMSDADTAYDTAFDAAVTHGKGYWRILTRYVDPWSFDQEIAFERILNPFCVYLDPSARRHPDYHTAAWGFLVERMAKSSFCEKYEVDSTSWGMWNGVGDTWVLPDECLVAEYYYQEQQPITLCRLHDGSLRYVLQQTHPDDFDDEDDAQAAESLARVVMQRCEERGLSPLLEGEQGQVALSRQSDVPVIRWCKHNGHTIVERTTHPGMYIPIVPVLGDEIDIEGRVDYRGIVRDAKDAQRMYNYSRSMAAESLALAPKAPYVGAVGQFKNHEREWQTANSTARGYLQYTPVDIHGTVLPPPQRNAVEPPIQAMSVFNQQAEHDLNSTTGIYPPALGQRSNETSGRAIRARQEQSQVGNSHFFGNLVRAIRHTGRILVDLIPHIYTPGRIQRILGEDGTQQAIQIQRGVPPGEHRTQTPGLDGVYDLMVGRYDVVIESGPSYQTKREEAADQLMGLVQAVPKVGDVGADIVVSNLDFHEADTLAQRLKKTIPPELLDEETQKPEEQVIVLQGQLRQVGQQLQQLNAYGQQAEQQAEQLAQENAALKLRLESKHADVAQDQQELAAQRQVDAAKIELEYRKLAWEREKFYATQAQTAAMAEREAEETTNDA